MKNTFTSRRSSAITRFRFSHLIVFFLFVQFGMPQRIEAQTTLSTGDISLVGWNSSTTPDGFAFVTWKNLQIGTVIKFTNNAFLSASSANTASNARVQQQIVYWTATSAISAGTVIKIDAAVTPTASSGTVSYSSQSQGTSLALSNTGGRIFIFQGSSDYLSAPTSIGTFLGNILYGLNYQGATGSAIWLTSGSGSSTLSYLPSELNNASLNLSFGSNANSGQYTGTRTGQSMATYKTNVQNKSNWTTTTGTGTTSFDLTAFSISGLPLTWGGVSAKRIAGVIQVNWETLSEQNTLDFDVQRSADGSNWTKIATLPAAGNSNTVKKYSFTDASPLTGNNFYRLQQKDIDGRNSYSSVVRVSTQEISKRSFSVPSNIVVNHLLQVTIHQPVVLNLFSGDGKLIWSKSLAAGFQRIELNALAKGIYILKGGSVTEKIMVR